MKHPAEEDLFMLAHRSLGLLQAARIWLHLRGCDRCRARYAEAVAMTSAVAGAVRGVRHSWRPFDRTLRTQALLAALLLGITVYAIQRAITAPPPESESWHNAAQGAALKKVMEAERCGPDVAKPPQSSQAKAPSAAH